MSKIQKIEIKNFKAISNLEVDFKGCTAIVTAGNNKGKTTLLRGIADRIRFIRPEVMVKDGAEEGKGEMTLTNGTKFIWQFDNKGKDKLEIIVKGELKKQVTKAIASQYFPVLFDIDCFLQSQPKEQIKQLQKIVGIDFTEIDARYQREYDKRSALNAEAERYHVKLSQMLEVPFVAPVDITDLLQKKEAERNRLNNLYRANVEHNNKLRFEYDCQRSKIDNEIKAINEELQRAYYEACRSIDAENRLIAQEIEYRTKNYNSAAAAAAELAKYGFTHSDLDFFINDLKKNIPNPTIKPQPDAPVLRTPIYPVEPAYCEVRPDDTELVKLDAEILAASQKNVAADEYRKYVDYKKEVDAAQQAALDQNDLVKSIEAERKAMIASVNFPKGIEITPSGITVDGFPLDRNQISTSKLYIAALRIAAMNLGEVRTLYFDASYLDRISLSEIEAWAKDNDLQLLIERPDYDGGDIRYELIED